MEIKWGHFINIKINCRWVLSEIGWACNLRKINLAVNSPIYHRANQTGFRTSLAKANFVRLSHSVGLSFPKGTKVHSCLNYLKAPSQPRHSGQALCELFRQKHMILLSQYGHQINSCLSHSPIPAEVAS